MARRMRPPSATIHVADGAGGMRSVVPAASPDAEPVIERIIPSSDAAEWMAHWHAVAEVRNWSGGGLTELEADQNAGTMSVYLASGAAASVIRCDWHRARGGDLTVRIAPADVCPPPESLVTEFVAEIDARLHGRIRESGFRRGWLAYEGLPWTGELWLTDSLRLGPPSRFPNALLGPQAVVVDASLEGIGRQGLDDAFARARRELCLVLSPILGVALRDGMISRQDWVPDINAENRVVDCRIGNIGYTELETALELPARGTAPALPLIPVNRPDLGPWGIRSGDQCIKVPDDVLSLWQQFQSQNSRRRDQFLRACNAYNIARSMFPNQRTAYATFLVVAIEALKPSGPAGHDANVYDVIATLLNAGIAAKLKALRHPPQDVRSQQVHRGELRSSELASYLETDAFADPSFDETLSELSRVARQCLIEWLRRGGIDKLVWMPRPESKKAKPQRPAASDRKDRCRR